MRVSAPVRGVVAKGLHRVDQVVDALLRQPRHLLLSGQGRQMAGRAAPRVGKLGAALDQRRIDRLVARLGRQAWRNASPAASRSSSLRSLTNGAIASTLRTPSRIRNSWFSMKNSGWPASDGMFSMRELPSSPWQAPQSWIRSASGMLCASAPPVQERGGRQSEDRRPPPSMDVQASRDHLPSLALRTRCGRSRRSARRKRAARRPASAAHRWAGRRTRSSPRRADRSGTARSWPCRPAGSWRAPRRSRTSSPGSRSRAGR